MFSKRPTQNGSEQIKISFGPWIDINILIMTAFILEVNLFITQDVRAIVMMCSIQ